MRCSEADSILCCSATALATLGSAPPIRINAGSPAKFLVFPERRVAPRSRAVLSSVAICVFCFSAGHSLAGQKTSDPAARELVRRIIGNELKAEESDHSHWMYLDEQRQSGTSVVQEVVETKAADMSLLVSRNGRPLTLAQRQQEIRRLRALATNPSAQRKERQTELEDTRKARNLLKLLPEAFLYRIDRQEEDRVFLSFQPNPEFHPPSREDIVFHAMAGTMVLDTKAQRLVELQGRMIKGVKFGFGILGHLDRGGQFAVKQSQVAPGCWELTELNVQMSGKMLFFKTIALHQQETRTDYRRVPDDITPAGAVAMLQNRPRTVTQSAAAHP